MDSELKDETSTSSKNQEKSTKEDTEASGQKTQISTKTRSRLIDMAISRHEQFEPLLRQAQDSSSKSHLQNAGELSLEPDYGTGKAKPSQKAEIKQQESELLKKLDTFKKQYGARSPFVAELELKLAVLSAESQEAASARVYELLETWLGFVSDLSQYGRGNSETSKESRDIKLLLARYGSQGLCRWSFDSGEILAMLFWGNGQPAEARQVVSSLLKLEKSTALDTQEATLRVHRLLTLARLCASQNEYVLAKEIISLAKETAKKQSNVIVLHNQHTVAMCLLEESRLSLAQRDFSAAAEEAGLAEKILETSTDIEATRAKALRAEALEQLARSLAAFPDKLADAIKNQEKCLRLRQEGFGREGIFCWSTMLDLCRMFRKQLNQEKKQEFVDLKSATALRTRNFLEQIIQACSKNQPKDNSQVLRADRNAGLLLPQAYLELGLLDASCGKFLEARDSIETAVKLDSKFVEPALIPNQVADLDALAALDIKEAHQDRARELVLKASRLLNSYVSDVLPQLSLAEQIAFSSNIEKHMNSLLSVCKNDRFLPELYGELIRWKGFLIEQFRLRSSMLKEKKNLGLRMLISKQHKISSSILTSFVSGKSGGLQNSEEQARKEALERQINLQMRGKDQKSAELSAAVLQGRLSGDEAFVDLYEFSGLPWDNMGARYAAVVVSEEKLSWVDLGASGVINEAVNTWRSYGGVIAVIPEYKKDASGQSKAGTGRSQGGQADQVEQGGDPWTKVRQFLYEPIVAAIPKKANRVWVSDESELSRLPWSVLLSSFGGARSFQVCQVDSPRELVLLKSKPQEELASSKRKEVLIVGGIDYSKHSPPAPPLEHALAEVKVIKAEMEKAGSKCLVQSDLVEKTCPTQEHIMDGLSKCRMAHLVTHGYFNESDAVAGPSDRSAKMPSFRSVSGTRASTAGDAFQMPTRNPLIESGLLVSKKNSSQNGFLTAEAMLDADLDGCRLVTLSACETARGRELSGQGVLGLRSALMGAGCRSVLVSLWPVPDRPTSELMKVFYKEMLAGDAPVVALQKAQEAVRKNPEWRAPYYWAAWVLVGDGWSKS